MFWLRNDFCEKTIHIFIFSTATLVISGQALLLKACLIVIRAVFELVFLGTPATTSSVCSCNVILGGKLVAFRVDFVLASTQSTSISLLSEPLLQLIDLAGGALVLSTIIRDELIQTGVTFRGISTG